MLKAIQKELSNHVGNYSKCVSLIEIKQMDFTDEEVNIILAKRRGWTSEEKVFCAMARVMIDHDFKNFDRPVNEIAYIMLALHSIYFTYRGEVISTKRSHRYAVNIYRNMFPDEIILYYALMDLKNNNVSCWNLVECICVALCILSAVALVCGGIGLYFIE